MVRNIYSIAPMSKKFNLKYSYENMLDLYFFKIFYNNH